MTHTNNNDDNKYSIQNALGTLARTALVMMLLVNLGGVGTVAAQSGNDTGNSTSGIVDDTCSALSDELDLFVTLIFAALSTVAALAILVGGGMTYLADSLNPQKKQRYIKMRNGGIATVGFLIIARAMVPIVFNALNMTGCLDSLNSLMLSAPVMDTLLVVA